MMRSILSRSDLGRAEAMVSVPLREVIPGDLIVECELGASDRVLLYRIVFLYRIPHKGSFHQKQVRGVSKRVWLVTEIAQMSSAREDRRHDPPDYLRAMALGDGPELEGWMELRTLHYHFTHGIRL